VHFTHTYHVWALFKVLLFNLKGKKMAISKTDKPSTAKKSIPKKTVSKRAAALKAPSVKKVATKKPSTKKSTKPSPEALYRMTEVAAYYIAQNNGFAGNPSDYWITAEAQISALYK
jgi:hypothetical protein